MNPKILTVGHSCLDIVHKVPSIPVLNAKIASSSVSIQVGGNAANVAVALCDMGADSDLCTVLGSEHHPFTRILLALLRERRVGISNCKFDNDQPCPNSTIMVLPDGERSIMNWQSDKIKSAISMPSSITDYAMIVADAYRLPMVRHVFLEARRNNIPTLIDIDGTISDIGLIPSADHIWFSYEAWKCHRIPLQDLKSRLGGIVGITNGPNPVTWIDHENIIRTYTPTEMTPINTLGAGDVFRARLALELIRHNDLTLSIKNACDSAIEHILEKPLTRVI